MAKPALMPIRPVSYSWKLFMWLCDRASSVVQVCPRGGSVLAAPLRKWGIRRAPARFGYCVPQRGADVEGHECPLAIVMRGADGARLDAFSFCNAAMQVVEPMQVSGVAIFQQPVNAAEQFNVRNLCLVQSKIFVISLG